MNDIEADLLIANAKIKQLKQQIADARNELCLKCGKYKTAHLGYCDGCRWKENRNER